jgi:uncharacterized protein YciI
MSLYLVQYAYSADCAGGRQQVRPAHAEYLAELEADGLLVLCGPYTDGSGALFLMRSETEEDCLRIFDADPFWKSGLVDDRRVDQFLVGFGLPDETDRVVRPGPVD